MAENPKAIVSASGLGRAVRCPASARLPQWPTFPIILGPRGAISPAERGTQIHRFMEVYVQTLDTRMALDAVEDDGVREECKGIDLELVYDLINNSEDVRTELAVALDIETGKARFLPPAPPGERYPLVSSTEVPGTIDLVCMDRTKGSIKDYKTGSRPGDVWQLRFAILAMEDLNPGMVFDAEFLYLDPDFGVWKPGGLIDTSDKTTWLAQLQEARAAWVRRGPTLDSDVSTGKHCSYCPAVESCPAYTRLIREAAQAVDARDFLSGLGDPARAYHHAKRMIDAGYRLLDRVENLAAIEPIDIGNGIELRPVDGEGNEQVKDAGKAIEVLQSVLGTDSFNHLASSNKVTKTGLKAALKQAKADGVLKGAVLTAMSDMETKLRLAGAVDRKAKSEIKEVAKTAFKVEPAK